MRELSDKEVRHVSGGSPLTVFAGFVGGLAVNYVYDSMGGYQGINAAVSGAWGSFVDASQYYYNSYGYCNY